MDFYFVRSQSMFRIVFVTWPFKKDVMANEYCTLLHIIKSCYAAFGIRIPEQICC